MVKCAVKICPSWSDIDDKAIGVTFHKVPKDLKRREHWIKVIRLLRKETDWLPSSASVICSKHFNDEDIIKPEHDKVRIRLSDNAVPVVIDEIDSQMNSNTEIDDEEMVEILEAQQKLNMKKMIKRLKFVSTNRLKCIKKLRQKIKRLTVKNNQLLHVIKEFKNKKKEKKKTCNETADK